MHTDISDESIPCLAILRLFEIYQISLQRMKAETLSWSSGWQSCKHDLVHKTRQKYNNYLNQQNNWGKYYLILIKWQSD